MPRFFVFTLLGLALTACGGATDKDDDDGGGGGGGEQPADSCFVNGHTYYVGESFPDGCNTCSCGHAGSVYCTDLPCSEDGCTYEGVSYDVGESFPATDGCNTCSCEEDGSAVCTRLACNTCESIDATSAMHVEAAKVCDWEAPNQCTQLVAGQLDCGCPTYVNPENEAAISALAAAHDEYAELMCGPSPCDCASPGGAYCSPAGLCVDTYDNGLIACQVNGQVYPSGSTGFAGPLGCHTCSCNNGELSCTEEACSSACPPNSALGSQCAECGPTCEVMEHGCLEVCSDTCENGSCIDGVCRYLCPL